MEEKEIEILESLDKIIITIEEQDVKFNRHHNGFYTASCKFKGNHTTFTYHDKDVELWGRGYSKNTLYSFSNGVEKRITNFNIKQVEDKLNEKHLNKIIEQHEDSLVKDTSLEESKQLLEHEYTNEEFNLTYKRFEKQLKKEEGIEKLEEEISGFKEDYAIDEAYGYNPPSEKDIENLSRLEILLDEKNEKINSILLDFKNNNDPSILLKQENIKNISLEEAKELVEKDNAPTPKLQQK